MEPWISKKHQKTTSWRIRNRSWTIERQLSQHEQRSQRRNCLWFHPLESWSGQAVYQHLWLWESVDESNQIRPRFGKIKQQKRLRGILWLWLLIHQIPQCLSLQKKIRKLWVCPQRQQKAFPLAHNGPSFKLCSDCFVFLLHAYPSLTISNQTRNPFKPLRIKDNIVQISFWDRNGSFSTPTQGVH